MLSVSEYAHEAHLSVARVRALASSGKISAQKLGNQWVILSSPKERSKPRGRLLSQSSFDRLAFFLEDKVEDLSPNEKRYAKIRAQKLRQEMMNWVEQHEIRADEVVKTYAVDKGSLQELKSANGLLLTGTSSQSAHVFGDILHAYIPSKRLRKLELVFSLREVPLSQANVILRAVGSVPSMSQLRLICDLAYEKDSRTSAEAKRLLEELLEGKR